MLVELMQSQPARRVELAVQLLAMLAAMHRAGVVQKDPNMWDFLYDDASADTIYAVDMAAIRRRIWRGGGGRLAAWQRENLARMLAHFTRAERDKLLTTLAEIYPQAAADSKLQGEIARVVQQEKAQVYLDQRIRECGAEVEQCAGIDDFNELAAIADGVVAGSDDDTRFARAELSALATRKLYFMLRKLEKDGHDFADIYAAYRRSKLLRGIHVGRRLRWRMKEALRRVGLYR